jgi:hypothetical protein
MHPEALSLIEVPEWSLEVLESGAWRVNFGCLKQRKLSQKRASHVSAGSNQIPGTTPRHTPSSNSNAEQFVCAPGDHEKNEILKSHGSLDDATTRRIEL